MADRINMDLYRAVACGGKQRFAERSHAVKAAKRRKGRMAYHCKACKGWHVGSTDWQRIGLTRKDRR